MPTLNYENVGALVEYDYLQGTITALYAEYDTADVTLKYEVVVTPATPAIPATDTTPAVPAVDEITEDKEEELFGVPIFYHCKDNSVAHSSGNGAIKGASSGFNINDNVVVMVGIDGCASLGKEYYVIGHYDKIKRCAYDTILISFVGEGVQGTQYIIWDVNTNDFSNIPLNADVDGNVQYIQGKFGLYYNGIDLTNISDWLKTVMSGYGTNLNEEVTNPRKYKINTTEVRNGWFMYPAGYPEYWVKIVEVWDNYIIIDKEFDEYLRSRTDVLFMISPSMPLYKKTKKASPGRYQANDVSSETSYHEDCPVMTLVWQDENGNCACELRDEPRGPNGSSVRYSTAHFGGFDYLQGYYLDNTPMYPVSYSVPSAGYSLERHTQTWSSCMGGEIFDLIYESGTIYTTNLSFIAGPIYEEHATMNVSGGRQAILALPYKRDIIFNMEKEDEDFGSATRIVGEGYTACATGCTGATAYPADQFQNNDSGFEVRYFYTNIETPLGILYPAFTNLYKLVRKQDYAYIAPTYSSITEEYLKPWTLPDMDYWQSGTGLCFSGCSFFSASTIFQIYAAELYIDGLKYFGDVQVQCEKKENTMDIDPYSLPRNTKLQDAIGKAHSVNATLYVLKTLIGEW